VVPRSFIFLRSSVNAASGDRVTKREVIAAVQSDVRSGKDRQQIFEAYRAEFPRPLTLAALIAGIAREEDKKKYRALNIALVALLVLGGATKVLTVWTNVPEINPVLAAVFSAVALAISLGFAYEVNRFTGAMYGLITVLAAVSLLNALLHVAKDAVGTVILAIFLGVILFLSIVLRQKLFPALRLVGVKMDRNGRYLLG
jgi:uncharacterized membrane protein